MFFATVRKENKKTKRTNLWETVAIILSIGALWPVVIWYNNAKQIIPKPYYIVLFIVLVVLVYITVRRVKRLRGAMRDAKNRKRQFPF